MSKRPRLVPGGAASAADAGPEDEDVMRIVPLGGGGTLSGPRRRAPRPNQSAASSAWTPSWVTIDVTDVVLAELPTTNRREGLLPL